MGRTLEVLEKNKLLVQGYWAGTGQVGVQVELGSNAYQGLTQIPSGQVPAQFLSARNSPRNREPFCLGGSGFAVWNFPHGSWRHTLLVPWLCWPLHSSQLCDTGRLARSPERNNPFFL